MIDTELDYKKDTDLYREFLKGDKEAFEIIVKRYRKSLIYFITKYVKNIEAAEDIAQDAFLYIIINKKEYDFKYSLKTYLYIIAKCRAINYLKRQSRFVDFKDEYIKEEKYDIDDIIIKNEQKQVIYNAVKKLKKEYQIVLELKEMQGFNNKEICKILNKTMPQTKMLIYRARKSLNKKLNKEESIC